MSSAFWITWLFVITSPFSSIINPNSLIIKHGFVEPSLKDAEAEKAYQFEREGYYCRDKSENTLVFNKTVGLRDTWNQ